MAAAATRQHAARLLNPSAHRLGWTTLCSHIQAHHAPALAQDGRHRARVAPLPQWSPARFLTDAGGPADAAAGTSDAMARLADALEPPTDAPGGLGARASGGSMLESMFPKRAEVATELTRAQLGARESGIHFSVANDQPQILQKFVNCMMQHGKKSVSQRILNEALSHIKTMELARIKKQASEESAAKDDGGDTDASDVVVHQSRASYTVNPTTIFLEALDNLMPILSTAPTKRGGMVYQVPYAVGPKRRQQLAIKWLIKACREKKGKSMPEKLADEIMAIRRAEGVAYGKKIELHKLAEANRAYANLRN